jgi:hypothetical protein
VGVAGHAAGRIPGDGAHQPALAGVAERVAGDPTVQIEGAAVTCLGSSAQ